MLPSMECAHKSAGALSSRAGGEFEQLKVSLKNSLNLEDLG